MAAETFQSYLEKNDIDDIELIITEKPTNTAVAAAEVHGVPVQNIVKSLILTDEEEFILALVPGDRRLDLEALSSEYGAQLRMTTPDEVKEVGGYSIGGVPPFGHKNKLETFIIQGFERSEVLVAAGGSSNSVFKVSYERLVELSDAQEVDL